MYSGREGSRTGTGNGSRTMATCVPPSPSKTNADLIVGFPERCPPLEERYASVDADSHRKRKATPPRRRIQFLPKDELLDVQYVASVHDMTDEEFEAMHYKMEDYAVMKKEMSRTVRHMMKNPGRPVKSKYCTRGLEHLQSGTVFAKRRKSKAKVVMSVLAEQERQRGAGADFLVPGTVDDEAIAYASIEHSRETKEEARSVALSDAIEEGHYRDVNDERIVEDEERQLVDIVETSEAVCGRNIGVEDSGCDHRKQQAAALANDCDDDDLHSRRHRRLERQHSRDRLAVLSCGLRFTTTDSNSVASPRSNSSGDILRRAQDLLEERRQQQKLQQRNFSDEGESDDRPISFSEEWERNRGVRCNAASSPSTPADLTAFQKLAQEAMPRRLRRGGECDTLKAPSSSHLPSGCGPIDSAIDDEEPPPDDDDEEEEESPQMKVERRTVPPKRPSFGSGLLNFDLQQQARRDENRAARERERAGESVLVDFGEGPRVNPLKHVFNNIRRNSWSPTENEKIDVSGVKRRGSYDASMEVAAKVVSSHSFFE